MMGAHNKYEEERLENAPVYQAPQAQTMQFYVPLKIFMAEAILLLALFRLFGFWVFVFIFPIHLLLMMKTSIDPYWFENMWCTFKKKRFKRNMGIRGKNTISFTPRMTRRELDSEK